MTTRSGGESGRHIAYLVRKTTFAYSTDDHHGDGRLSIITKAGTGEQQALIETDSVRFFVPPYLGSRGWVGLWLDRSTVGWSEVEELMIDAFRLTASSPVVS